LKGSGNDPDGNAISFNWRKIAGPPAGAISSPAAAQTVVTGLSMGIYKFELSVTDALGAVAKDTVEIHDGMAVLPLNLLDFTAGEQGNHILLQWATSSEINTSHFEIEKLGDANLYLKSGAMAAKAISQPVNKYQFADYGVTPGLNYYRLKIIDKDGQFTYSRIVTVNVKTNTSPVLEVVSMRANGDAMSVKLTSREEGPASILLADMQGRILSSKKVILTKGLNQFNQNISLQRAAYIVKITKEESQFTGRFIKE
ncbi:MAG: T9SS type A sorting domain-containing protein, partial [Chitinophagaceae bacterium]